MLRLLLRGVRLLQSFRLLNLFRGNGDFQGLRFLFTQERFRLRDVRFSFVFARDCRGFGFGDGNSLLHLRVRLTDGTFLVLFGDGNSRLVDGFGGGFLAERDDIARFVGNIRDVDVDEF